jgi:hypothetical protein
MISQQGRNRLRGIACEMASYKEIYRQHAELYQSRLAHMALTVMSRIDEIEEILNEHEKESKNDCICKRR